MDCMFSFPAQPLCLQATGGRGEGGATDEENAGNVKPDLLPYLLPPSLPPPPPPLPPRQRASESNLILSLQDWKHTPREGEVEEGRREGKEEKQRGREIEIELRKEREVAPRRERQSSAERRKGKLMEKSVCQQFLHQHLNKVKV